MKALWVGVALYLCSLGVALSQDPNDFAWVHKTYTDLTEPPWVCTCYSVSRQSLIVGSAQSQTWPVARYYSWGNAVAARNVLTTGPAVCGFCSAPMAGATGPGGGGPGGGGGGGGGVAGGGTGAGPSLFVYGNCAGGECILGVADAAYSATGWSSISPPFHTHDEAWQYACDLHNQGTYRSPDIDRGIVDCATLLPAAQSSRPGGGWSHGGPETCASQYGNFTFNGASDGLLARYDSDDGRLFGEIVRDDIDGVWVEGSSASRCDAPYDGSYYWGRFVGRLTPDGFDAQWSYCDAAPSKSWGCR